MIEAPPRPAMRREIVLTFVHERISAQALLLDAQAPRTCDAIWRALPVIRA
jgi:hypothetical protein